MPEEEEPAESDQSRWTTSVQTPSRFTGAVLVTSAADVNDKLDYYRRIHPMDLHVEDQFFFSLGVRTDTVKTICASSGDNCQIDVSGYRAFKSWLHALVVVGPYVPISAIQLDPCAAAAKTSCEKSFTNCGAMRLGELLTVQIRELAVSSRATYAQLHDAAINDIGSMPLVCSTGTPPSFRATFPGALWYTTSPIDVVLQEKVKKLQIKCIDSITDTCSLRVERKVLKEDVLGEDYNSRIGQAFVWAIRTDGNGKDWDYLLPPSHIAELAFNSYQSTCTPLSAPKEYNGIVYEKGDYDIVGEKFDISYPSTEAPQLKYLPYSDQTTPSTPAWAVETTFTPINIAIKNLYARGTADAVQKIKPTGPASYGIAKSKSFCAAIY